MPLKRPKTVLLLMAVFSWSFLKGIALLVRGSTAADRILYDEAGLGWLAVSVLTVIALLDLAAVAYLIKPAPIGRLVCLASIGLSAAHTSIGLLVARAYPDVARRAFVVSRESRGLPAPAEAIDAALDPTMSLLLLCGSLMLSAALAALVLWNRNYFLGSVSVPPQPAAADEQGGNANLA